MEERRRRDGEDVEVPDKKNVGGEDKSIAEAVMFWNGKSPVINSHSTIPKLYTSTF
jgi:hypothetical protein